MKNIPEKIFLDLGFIPDQDDDFKKCNEVTWGEEKPTDSTEAKV